LTGGGSRIEDGRNTQDSREGLAGEKAIWSENLKGINELTGPDYFWGPFHGARR
jgi:hypothetical protein